MEPTKPPANDIYLTKDEVIILLDGINLKMEKHYQSYDADLPEDLVILSGRMMTLKSSFVYCHTCRKEWVRRWSNDECTTCPGDEEE